MKKFDLHNDSKIESGFKIPDDYFDAFENRLMQKLPIKEKVKVVPLWERKSFWISSVAAVFIISFGTWMYFDNIATENNISSSEYLAFESDLTAEDIALHLTDEDIETIENEMNLYDSETEAYVNEYLN